MRRAPLLATALACAVTPAACGSSKSSSSGSLSTAQTRAAIEESILRERHLHAAVTCPATVTKEKGATFECLAVASNGQRTTFHVIEVNSHGGVRYSSPPAPLPSVE